MLLETEAGEVSDFVRAHLASDTDKPLRVALREFADQRGIPL